MLPYLYHDEDIDCHIFLFTAVHTVDTCEGSRQKFMESDYGGRGSYASEPGAQTAAHQQALVS